MLCYICTACCLSYMQFNKALRHTISWKVVNTVITFCINLLLVRLLGTSQSGVFFYDVTLLSMLVLLQGFSLESGIIFIGSKKNDDGALLSAALIQWLILQVFVAALLFQFINLSLSMPYAVLFVISNIAITYFTALFAANKIFLTPNVISATVNFLLLAVLCIFWFSGNPSSQNTAILKPAHFYIGGFAIQALLLLIFFRKDFKTGFDLGLFKVSFLKKLFSFSGIAFISNLLFFLLTRIDYYFVARYCSETALANYIQVSKFGQLLILVPSLIAAVIFPFTAGTGEKKYLEKTQFYCRVITGVFIPLMLAVAATGFWLFPLLFGDDFDQMYMAMLFYLPGFYALSIVTVIAAYTGGRGMILVNLAASALSLVVVVVADILLIPVCGINGAAIASSLAYFACMIFLLVRLRKKEYFFTTDFFGLKPSDLKKLTSF